MTGSALNARLLSAAEFVRQNATFADIGTDHAYLPLFLLEGGRIRHAYCCDINEGPLASARRNAEECGRLSDMDFILTDGTTVLAHRGIGDYAICGMGGELIADIIDRAPHLKDSSVNLILQPMTRQAHLRRYLAEAGFEVTRESYSYDGGKYYVCLLASYTGKCRELTDVEAELGIETPKNANNDAQIGYINTKIAALTRAAEGKRRGGETDIPEEEIIRAFKERLSLLSKEGKTK